MIQRIQSLYLLIVTALMVVLLFVPLGKFLGGDTEFILSAFGLKEAHSEAGGYVVRMWPMGILMVMATILPFIAIFVYKDRILQIRICFMEIVFLIGVQIFIVYSLYHATSSFSELANHSVVYSVVDLFPVICLLFTWLANRAIIKDEALVKSLNRIR